MNPISRFFVNFGNARRSARVLRALERGFRPPPTGRILELGAGRGGLSALLQERYRPGRLVVTDFDPHQVEAARAFLTQRFRSLPSTIELRQVDAKALPFEDRSFDCVFAILMLHHVEKHHSEYRERPVALREIRRVLAPGGSLVYSDFSHMEDLRRTLEELGFARTFEKRQWPRRELAVVRAPS
ncbi:MAG: class I SAM-dependent methyltransferase [Thermoplasmata archaeon]